MIDCFRMWRHTRMVTLTAVCAAIYAAALIPTQVFAIIPGSTNLRPGNAVAIVLSLLFGPAGAWGAAFGNTLNDFFGTFGPGTWFGFLGNFLFGLIPYRLWNAWSRDPMPPRGWRGWALFGAGVIVASAATALVIAWGLHLLGFVPFTALGSFIFLNNSVFGLALGPPLVLALAPRVRAWGLSYEEILEEDERKPGAFARPASLLLSALVLGGLVFGLFLTSGLPGTGWVEGAGTAAGPMLILLPLVVLVFLVALLV